MITNHRKVVWAEELGIDMEKLRKESPEHFDQLMMKRRLGQTAQAYWARERYLARVAEEIRIINETPPPERKKPTKRSAPVRRVRMELMPEVKEALKESDGFKKPDSLRTKPVPKKRAKVRRYEFTDKQLEIARRVLNGGGSV